MRKSSLPSLSQRVLPADGDVRQFRLLRDVTAIPTARPHRRRFPPLRRPRQLSRPVKLPRPSPTVRRHTKGGITVVRKSAIKTAAPSNSSR